MTMTPPGPDRPIDSASQRTGSSTIIHNRSHILLVVVCCVITAAIGAFFILPKNILIEPQIKPVTSDGDFVDPCDKSLVDKWFPEQSMRIDYICIGVGAQKHKSYEEAKNFSSWHYDMQIAVLIFSAVSTILVAMRGINDMLANFAILPTAIVTMLTGIASLYSYQNRFVSEVGIATSLAHLESEIEYVILTEVDNAKKTDSPGKLDDAKIERWYSDLSNILDTRYSYVLGITGKATTLIGKPAKAEQ